MRIFLLGRMVCSLESRRESALGRRGLHEGPAAFQRQMRARWDAAIVFALSMAVPFDFCYEVLNNFWYYQIVVAGVCDSVALARCCTNG